LAEVYVKTDDYDSAIAVLTEGYEKSGDENLKKRLDEYGQRQLSTDEPETVAREEEPAAPEKTDEEKPHDFSKVVFPKSAFDYELMGKNWLDWEYDALAASVKTLPVEMEEDGMWQTMYEGTVAQVYQNFGIRFIELYDGIGDVHVEDNLEQNTFLIDLRGPAYEEGGGWLNKCELLGTPAKDFLAQYSPEFAEEVLAFFSDDANESNIGYKSWTLQNCTVRTELFNGDYGLRFNYNDAGKNGLPPCIVIDKNSFLITSVNAVRFNGKP
jgi:hypothetical protein